MGTRRTTRQSDPERRMLLVAALQSNAGQAFRAGELKRVAGVPKSVVRGLLTAVDGVTVSDGPPYYFSWNRSGPSIQNRSLVP